MKLLLKSTPPVDAAGDEADRRHDDVVHERFDDSGEGGADDDADRHVHDVAAQRKFLEFFQHRPSLLRSLVSASSLPSLGSNPNRADA
jgi:hypothetical protein